MVFFTRTLPKRVRSLGAETRGPPLSVHTSTVSLSLAVHVTLSEPASVESEPYLIEFVANS